MDNEEIIESENFEEAEAASADIDQFEEELAPPEDDFAGEVEEEAPEVEAADVEQLEEELAPPADNAVDEETPEAEVEPPQPEVEPPEQPQESDIMLMSPEVVDGADDAIECDADATADGVSGSAVEATSSPVTTPQSAHFRQVIRDETSDGVCEMEVEANVSQIVETADDGEAKVVATSSTKHVRFTRDNLAAPSDDVTPAEESVNAVEPPLVDVSVDVTHADPAEEPAID